MSTPRPEDGYTLSELLVVMALLGAMMAIAVSGWSSWSKASAQRGTAQELQSVLRQVQQRAVTEGREFRVRFDLADDTYTVHRVTEGAGGTEVENRVLGPMGSSAEAVELTEPSFNGGLQSYLVFNARGTASPGQVEVTRDGADAYVVSVEGLSGHVSLD